MSRWSAIVGYSLVGAATQLVWLNFAGVTTVAATHYAVSETAIGWLAQVFPSCTSSCPSPAVCSSTAGSARRSWPAPS